MRKIFLIGCFSFCSHLIYAQQPPQSQAQPKPSLFTGIPYEQAVLQKTFKIKDVRRNLINLFDKKVSEKVSFPIPNSYLTARVLTKKEKNAHVTVMTLQVTNYDNAIMSVIKKTDNGQVSFIGTVINKDYGDALVLTRVEDRYVFVATPLTKLIID